MWGFLLGNCLATIRGHIDTQTDERGFMGSSAMMYIPTFITIGSAIQELMGGRGYIDSKEIA
jgi:hypothetical protein